MSFRSEGNDKNATKMKNTCVVDMMLPSEFYYKYFVQISCFCSFCQLVLDYAHSTHFRGLRPLP